MTIELIDNYWVDRSTNNRYNKNDYSFQEAEKAFKTLINCKNCTDCIDCIDCTDCHNCLKCIHCIECKDCSYNTYCTNCTKTLNSNHCNDCNDCSECIHCNHCKSCAYSVQLINCERCRSTLQSKYCTQTNYAIDCSHSEEVTRSITIQDSKNILRSYRVYNSENVQYAILGRKLHNTNSVIHCDNLNHKHFQIGTKDNQEFGIYLKPYTVRFIEDRIYIGCQKHTIEEWDAFSYEEIDEMDYDESIHFWRKNKDFILSLAQLLIEREETL